MDVCLCVCVDMTTIHNIHMALQFSGIHSGCSGGCAAVDSLPLFHHTAHHMHDNVPVWTHSMGGVLL